MFSCWKLFKTKVTMDSPSYSPKLPWKSKKNDARRRSYAYVTAVQRKAEAHRDSCEDLKMKGSPMLLKKSAHMESKARLAGTKSESDLTNTSNDLTEDEHLVQSSLKLQGSQNLTVTAGSGSVFYFHYPLPNDQQPNPSSRRGSATSQTIPDIDHVDEVEETDGVACDEDTIDEVVDLADEARHVDITLETTPGTDVDAVVQDSKPKCHTPRIDVDAKPKCQTPKMAKKLTKQTLSEKMSLPKMLPAASYPIKAPQQRRLVLIGYTGGGKSETGNSILCDRDLFDSLPGFASITKDCHKSSGKDLRCTGPDANEVVVVDTPGLFDTNDDPEVIAKKITGCIINASPGPHAILLVTPIARMTTEVQQAADGLRKLFGDRSLQYMIVVFTHLDAIKRKKSIKGIEQMIDLAPPALYRILQECNNRYVAFDNTLDPESQENKDQVARLLDLVDTTVEGNGGHCYTNDLLEEANRLMEMEKKRHEKEIEEKFKAREARIRAEYEKHLEVVDSKQRQLEDVQEKRRELEEKKSKELQTKIERQQSQIRTKEEQHAKVLKEEKTKYKEALKSMNTILDDLQTDLKKVESEKTNLKHREIELSDELLMAIEERDRTTMYLVELETELERELNIPVRIDPSKPPKSIVEVVTKRVRRCPIL